MLSKKVADTEIADTEILWALKCVYFHFSGNSSVGVNDLFNRMFSDSEIAVDYSMSESKFRYVTTFELGPYFTRKLLCDVEQSLVHALLFDKSLTEEVQSKQLDVHVQFWSSENCRVESKYPTSLFIGQGRAHDILNHYEETTNDLNPEKTWNIDMDGPNVNLAFERELRKSREELNLRSLLYEPYQHEAIFLGVFVHVHTC